MIRCCCGLAGSFRWRGPLSWNKGQLTDESADTNETNAVSVSGATQSRNVARWPSMHGGTARDRPSAATAASDFFIHSFLLNMLI